MAKNTLSSEFRQLDVDQYNEDNFREEDGEVTLPAGVDEETVINLMNKGQWHAHTTLFSMPFFTVQFTKR